MMRLGELLVAANLVGEADVEAALDRQRAHGGRLGTNLVACGAVSAEALEAFLAGIPPEPRSLAEVRLPEGFLLDLLLKHLAAGGVEDVAGLSSVMRLAPQVVMELVERAVLAQLVSLLGGIGLMARLDLTHSGKARATEALLRCGWRGPAPISFETWVHWLDRQKVSNESVDRAAFDRAFGDLDVGDLLAGQLGPALISGRAVLMYGPPGNGKTSVAQRLERVFRQIVHIPHAVFIDGEVVTIFDADLHSPLDPDGLARPVLAMGLHRDEADGRFVTCRRPFVVAGGELTLDMLDLRHGQHGVSVAPLHIKAAGGCMLIDDFGRQIVSPTALLNRWIVPLENRVDYLKLASGKSVRVPFEAVVIFSTNLAPADLMDPAFLRRIPYKIEVGAPTPERWKRIFAGVARAHGLGDQLTDAITAQVLASLTEQHGLELAAFQPRFIIEQLIACCRFRGISPDFVPELLEFGIGNLGVGSGRAPSTPTLAKVA